MWNNVDWMQSREVCSVIEGVVGGKGHTSSLDGFPRECTRKPIVIVVTLVVMKVLRDTDTCQGIACMIGVWASVHLSEHCQQKVANLLRWFIPQTAVRRLAAAEDVPCQPFGAVEMPNEICISACR